MGAKPSPLFFFFLAAQFLVTMTSPEAEAASALVRKHDSCESCHRMAADRITADMPFPEGVDPSAICLDCHHYTENHHPVDFTPREVDPDGVSLNSFPLFDSQVRCLTCHEVHGDSGPAGRPKLLRGGPYAERTEICFRCHDRDLNTRVDPHIMHDEYGMIRKYNGSPICLMCHASVPEQSKGRAQVTFKADVAFLCWRCHTPMPGQFFNNHFLVTPSKKTRRIMKKAEQEQKIVLPLLNRDRITCSTCHNPHQEGIVRYTPANAGADLHDRLRMPPDTICSACHDI